MAISISAPPPSFLPVQQPPQATVTQQNNALAVALATGRTAASTVKTQTARAAAPTGSSDQGRGTQDGTRTGHGADTAAQTVRARTNGAPRGRGDKLDVSV